MLLASLLLVASSTNLLTRIKSGFCVSGSIAVNEGGGGGGEEGRGVGEGGGEKGGQRGRERGKGRGYRHHLSAAIRKQIVQSM